VDPDRREVLAQRRFHAGPNGRVQRLAATAVDHLVDRGTSRVARIPSSGHGLRPLECLLQRDQGAGPLSCQQGGDRGVTSHALKAQDPCGAWGTTGLEETQSAVGVPDPTIYVARTTLCEDASPLAPPRDCRVEMECFYLVCFYLVCRHDVLHDPVERLVLDSDRLNRQCDHTEGRLIKSAPSVRFAGIVRCPVSMADLIRATFREYRKLGRLIHESEFGPWLEAARA
jgi:hypothetical protein